MLLFSASNELVFINFYADWCRFSNLLAPIFDEVADKVNAEFPDGGLVVMGKVDCDKESKLLYSMILCLVDLNKVMSKKKKIYKLSHSPIPKIS